MPPKAESTPGPGGPARPDGPADLAGLTLDTLAGLEPELRAAAVVTDEGSVLATTTGDEAWGRTALELLGALDEVGTGDLDSSHITTEEAEVFVVREAGLALVAVTARFVLASLTSFDIRMSLRDLAGATPDPGAPGA